MGPKHDPLTVLKFDLGFDLKQVPAFMISSGRACVVGGIHIFVTTVRCIPPYALVVMQRDRLTLAALCCPWSTLRYAYSLNPYPFSLCHTVPYAGCPVSTDCTAFVSGSKGAHGKVHVHRAFEANNVYETVKQHERVIGVQGASGQSGFGSAARWELLPGNPCVSVPAQGRTANLPDEQNELNR
jgi:hypothetical protein